MNSLPIGDYALLSDCHSAALVSRAGSVDWLCFPRFDGPAVFARILDPGGGHFAIRPIGDFEASRRYVAQTMVLETTFRTESGTVVLTDAMAMGATDQPHGLGDEAPGALLRRLECIQGTMEVDITYAPRPEYGLIYPILETVANGVTARGGASRLLLSAPAGVQIAGPSATARYHLVAGQAASFALQHGLRCEPPPATWDEEQIAARLRDTLQAWRSWSTLHQTYEGPWRDLVHHCGRVLQALRFQPTGAIVAAPTTSLPEAIGGERNWDYRYAWVRDACLTMEALWVAACPYEASEFFGFLADATASELKLGRDLQIMFGIGGEHDLSERELPDLAGWRDSRPVRVGNGAWRQRQLDVYGELLNAAQRLVERLGGLDQVTQQFLAAAADAAASMWTKKDQGIWEIRGEPRHYLYSKLMCWVAVDRAIEIAPQLGAEDRVAAWATARDEIRAAILEQGWSEQAGAFTQAFGSDDLDASALMLAITRFLPGDDPRMKATIETISARLTDKRGLVYRYKAADGMAGAEGTFLICTFWLAHAQVLAGDVDQATATFERAIATINDVGLMAEQVEPGTGELIGNFPQAFSHVGLVNAAWAIAQAPARSNLSAGGRLQSLTPAGARDRFRAGVRMPTAGCALGFAQANLIILPQDAAGEFERFAGRNPGPCPLLDMTAPGSAVTRLAPGADLRTDLPAYRIWEHGQCVAEPSDIIGYWRDDLVAFLTGCSFTFERALLAAGVPVRHLEQGTNVAMFITNRQCKPAGRFAGPLAVSMRPVPASLVATATSVTARYPASHGAPVHAGNPAVLGITDLSRPDFGDAVRAEADDVPVFWACGVTSQVVLLAAQLPFAVTHSPGHMLITDVPDNDLTFAATSPVR